MTRRRITLPRWRPNSEKKIPEGSLVAWRAPPFDGPHGCIDRSEDYRILSGLEFIELSGSSNIVPAAAAVARTALQKRLGGYRPELPHSGDMEMWLRFAAHGSVGMFEAPQAVYRRHDGNMSVPYLSRSGLQDLVERKAAFDCFFETCGPAV